VCVSGGGRTNDGSAGGGVGCVYKII